MKTQKTQKRLDLTALAIALLAPAIGSAYLWAAVALLPRLLAP